MNISARLDKQSMVPNPHGFTVEEKEGREGAIFGLFRSLDHVLISGQYGDLLHDTAPCHCIMIAMSTTLSVYSKFKICCSTTLPCHMCINPLRVDFFRRKLSQVVKLLYGDEQAKSSANVDKNQLPSPQQGGADKDRDKVSCTSIPITW